MKKSEGWFVNYDDGYYEDFEFFGENEDAAWHFYVEMNEETGSCASEPEYDFEAYTDDEIVDMYTDLGAMGDNRDCSERYWQLLCWEHNHRLQLQKDKADYENRLKNVVDDWAF